MNFLYLIVIILNEVIMKKSCSFVLIVLFVVIAIIPACKKDSTSESPSLGGSASPMGAVGTLVNSASYAISGISGLNATVVSSSDGISSYSGSGVVTNAAIRDLLNGLPGITISGENVTFTGMKFRQTTEGIESFISSSPGIIVNYNSNVGDTYPVGSNGDKRTVVSKSSTDDYFYGGLMIKVIKVEEPLSGVKSLAVNKITYIANHKFGLVGVQYNFNDGTSVYLPVYCSTTNGK
jgi:hypothetical protein